jgi:hypothetical protein
MENTSIRFPSSFEQPKQLHEGAYRRSPATKKAARAVCSQISAIFFNCFWYISRISLVVVASSAALSDRYLPVNLGNLMASPLPLRTESSPHV